MATHERRYGSAGRDLRTHDEILVQKSNKKTIRSTTKENNSHQETRCTQVAGAADDDGALATETITMDRTCPAANRRRSFQDGGEERASAEFKYLDKVRVVGGLGVHVGQVADHLQNHRAVAVQVAFERKGTSCI